MTIQEFVKNNPYRDGNCVVVSGEELYKFLSELASDYRPDNLDYEQGHSKEFLLGYIPSFADPADFMGVPIVFDYDFRFSVEFGANEGIYIDLWFERTYRGELQKVYVATIKTLDDSDDSFRAMSRYATELYLSYNNFGFTVEE